MFSDFSASAAFQGYLYQARYALYFLLSSRLDNPEIFLETFDDISCHTENGKTTLFQLKHIDGSLSDSSEILWKTIRIWCTLIRDGSINLKDANFSIITTGTAIEGSIASCLRPSLKKSRNETKALENLKRIAGSSSNKMNQMAYRLFLELERPLPN